MNFPNPYPQPSPQAYGQQAYGAPQQPQVPQQPLATQSVDEFFAGGVGGGAPSAGLGEINSQVVGTIVDMKASQRTKMGTNEPLFNKDGSPQMQLIVTLQTQHRGWENVKKVPTTTGPDGREYQKDPNEDDGKRRIFVWYTLRQAFEQALVAIGQTTPKIGDEVAVRVSQHDPNPMGGQPIKQYQVAIRPGAPAADAFFGQGQPQQAPPPPVQQQPAPQAPPVQAPPPYQQGVPQGAPPMQQPPQAPPAQNPWANAGQPPF